MNTKGQEKILFFVQNMNGGGAEKVFLNLLNHFASQGFKVELLLGKKEGIFLKFLNFEIPVHELNAKTFLAHFIKLGSFFKKYHYTKVLVCGDYITVACILALKMHLNNKVEIIPVLQYDVAAQNSFLPKANQVLINLLYRYFIISQRSIIASSKGIVKNIEKIVKRKCDHISVIYNPVVDEGIENKEKEIVNESIFSVPAIRIINVGRLVQQKDQATLIKAFSILRKRRSDLQLVFVGLGTDEPDLKKLAMSLGVEKSIFFLGFKENPFSYMAKSHLFVLSSVYEGFGNVVAEALAVGLNVVSTDCPSGPSEILENGKFGWLVEPGNDIQMAQAIETALSNPFPSSILKERAGDFQIDRIAKQYLKTIGIKF